MGLATLHTGWLKLSAFTLDEVKNLYDFNQQDY